ncbi:solute carrier family 35 member E1 homolog [Ornithodoros turicata]|uniref:solute carrier family 35 member E1 homolog n=1 Tax=Ornithodoros turicata TaxID=34597 RepID=UPI0031389CBA
MSSSKEILQVVVLCAMWYAISSGNNVVGKVVLNNFPYPLTVTVVQLFSISVYSGPAFAVWGIRPYLDLDWNTYIKCIIPLAFGKLFSIVTSHISLWKVPVSYAHTVKATMPFFTVVLSRIILREKQACAVYLSLLPIILGVMIATLTEISFNMMGLICAVTSTIGFALQNIYTKKVIRDTNVHYLRLLHTLARLALLFVVPFWLLLDVRRYSTDTTMFAQVDAFLVLLLLFLDGALNFAQNLVAFTILNLVSPLTYSVCNASKRIAVISVSLLLLHNPVTALNIFGMMLAVLGVLCYNKAKYDANQAQREAKLPLSVKDTKSLLLSDDVFPQGILRVIPANGTVHSFSAHNSKLLLGT